MITGIGSYTFPWALGVPGYPACEDNFGLSGLLKKADVLGIKLVQIADNVPLEALSGTELQELKKAADERGIVLQTGTRGDNIEHLLKYLDISKKLGSSLLRTIIIDKSDSPKIDHAIQNIRSVASKFENEDIHLSIENHDSHSTGQLVRLIEEVNNSHVGICLDTVNSFAALECPDQVIQSLLPYCSCIHVKDFTIRRHEHLMGFSITGTPAGKGKLDIQALIDTISKVGRSIDLILELWTPYQGNIRDTIAVENRWAEESISYLDKITNNR